VVVAEVRAKPRPLSRPKDKPKAPAAPVDGQPVQVADNQPQIGAPANEVSSAPAATPAETVPQAAESVIEQIVAPATTSPEPAAPAAPAPAEPAPAVGAPTL